MTRTFFLMLCGVCVALLVAGLAYAWYSYDDVPAQVDVQGNLIIEESCARCNATLFRIKYTSSWFKLTEIYSGFDRDMALDFTPIRLGPRTAFWDTAWITNVTDGKTCIGFDEEEILPTVLNIADCAQLLSFSDNRDYVFEVEILGDGVFWSNRNLSLYHDVEDAVYDETDDVGYIGGNPYGPYEDNVIRFVLGENLEFFCAKEWVTAINDEEGWNYPDTRYAGDFSWVYGYAAVRDYSVRNYDGSNFDGSDCSRTGTPFDLTRDDGLIHGDPTANFAATNAKVLRTYPVTLPHGGTYNGTHQSQFAQTPYMYLDLPTMVYDCTVADICDVVNVIVTIAKPFLGVCAICCNIPMCSCKQYVGTMGLNACRGSRIQPISHLLLNPTQLLQE